MTAHARLLAATAAVVLGISPMCTASGQDRDDGAVAGMSARGHYHGSKQSRAGTAHRRWPGPAGYRGIDRGSAGMTCWVWSRGGDGSGGFDAGYCLTYEPGFGTQHQPLPLLW
jgi:hypothetical protein